MPLKKKKQSKPVKVEECPSCKGSGWNKDNSDSCLTCDGKGTDDK